jgi:hypothetical protein
VQCIAWHAATDESFDHTQNLFAAPCIATSGAAELQYSRRPPCYGRYFADCTRCSIVRMRAQGSAPAVSRTGNGARCHSRCSKTHRCSQVLTAESLLLVQVHAVVTFPRHCPPSLHSCAPFCAAVLEMESITKAAIRPSWCFRCFMAAVSARLRANLGQHKLLRTDSSIGEMMRCLEDLLHLANGCRGTSLAATSWCCNTNSR